GPPGRPSTTSARSRFTPSPGCSAPTAVRRSVSPITWAVKSCPSVRSVTVRQQPFTLTESPMAIPLETRSQAIRIAPVPAWASVWTSIDSTRPTSSTIPVNISVLLLAGGLRHRGGRLVARSRAHERQHDVVPVALQIPQGEAFRVGERGGAVEEQGTALVAEDHGRQVQLETVDQARGLERARHPRAAL